MSQNLDPFEGWIPIADACRLAGGLSWGQAYRLVLRGDLEGRQVGRAWLVSTASVARLRETRRTKGKAVHDEVLGNG